MKPPKEPQATLAFLRLLLHLCPPWDLLSLQYCTATDMLPRPATHGASGRQNHKRNTLTARAMQRFPLHTKLRTVHWYPKNHLHTGEEGPHSLCGILWRRFLFNGRFKVGEDLVDNSVQQMNIDVLWHHDSHGILVIQVDYHIPFLAAYIQPWRSPIFFHKPPQIVDSLWEIRHVKIWKSRHILHHEECSVDTVHIWFYFFRRIHIFHHNDIIIFVYNLCDCSQEGFLNQLVSVSQLLHVFSWQLHEERFMQRAIHLWFHVLIWTSQKMYRNFTDTYCSNTNL